jgi:hypothetical protein
MKAPDSGIVTTFHKGILVLRLADLTFTKDQLLTSISPRMMQEVLSLK